LAQVQLLDELADYSRLSEAEMDGDPTRLQQVLSNLFSNAIKFTPSGGNVRIELDSNGDCHTIKVSDPGEGISAEFLPFVFDRYRQADQTAGRGGLGLGLTIARSIDLSEVEFG
jgi:signal transduction histidine kinase